MSKKKKEQPKGLPGGMQLTGRTVAVERPKPPTAAQCLELVKLLRAAARAVPTTYDDHVRFEVAADGVEAYLQSQAAEVQTDGQGTA